MEKIYFQAKNEEKNDGTESEWSLILYPIKIV